MNTVKIVGVPEHFNFPWHLCIENGEFEEIGIDLQWTDIPEGTGKMCQMLRNGETDIAVILSEGIVKDIINDNPSSIVQVYVESPLVWGIHVSAKSNFQKLEDLENTTIAISREGSGSHLMAFVNAKNQNWSLENLKFETVHTINGAVDALTNGKADYFMWEHFMTKPLVDKGIFRRLADCPTPWPSFVIAVRNEFLETNRQTLELILEVINNTTIEFREIPSIDRTLAIKYNQNVEDIREWLSQTQWSQKKLKEKEFENIQNQLFELKIIDKKISFTDIFRQF